MQNEDTPGTSATVHRNVITPSASPPPASAARPHAHEAQTPRHWFASHSFAPDWLPKGLRHPLLGYGLAICLQIIAVLLTSLLMQFLPSFAFAGLLSVFAITLVALTWGAGPSLLATFVGVILLDATVLAPHFASPFDARSLLEMLLFLLVGLTLSGAASRFEHSRRNAEALATSLNNERAHLEAVIDAVPDAISIHDAQGSIVRVNQLGLQHTNPEGSQKRVEHAPGAFSVRRLSGELLPLEDFPVARALAGETISGFELSFPGSDGQDRFASLSAAPLHDAHGKLDGAIVITHDITRLHRSEREAAARANELEAIFEAMTDGIFVFDSQGHILRMNAAARTPFHLDQAPEFYSRRLTAHTNIFAPLDELGRPLPEEVWPMYRILQGETLSAANAVDMRFRSRAGVEYLLNVSGAPMYDKAGAVSGAVCICQDVTLQRQLEKRTQETLKALLAMAETLVLEPGASSNSDLLTSQSAPQGLRKVARRMAELTSKVLGCQRVSISAVDPESEMLSPIAVVGLSPEQEEAWWNEGLAAKTRLGDGLEPAQLARLFSSEILLLDMSQEPFNALANPHHVKVFLTAPMSVGKQIVGLLLLDYGGVEHEYTQDEIALAKAVAKLAALVIERERLLRERADARASELALREANRRMDEFLGMTSHELKTPLTSIKGNTQLTFRQLKNSLQGFQKMHDMLESTERQIKLLDRLVDDLLDISRTQADHLALNVASCDLKEIIRSAVEEQRLAWSNRSIVLDMPAEHVAGVSADSDRIKQVVTNYLTNALKFSPEDRPVRVELRQEAGQVRVAVIDKGAGLSLDEQTHIWERFWRAQGSEVLSTSHTSMLGLGLGLFICKTIIEEHHGSVGVESSPGSGSSFWFTLPPAETSANTA